MSEPPPQEEPHKAVQAMARYRRVMALMMVLTTLMVGASFIALFRENGVASARFYMATALGVGFAMLLMSALLGLVFLTGGKGQADAAATPLEDDEDDED